ncbi:MAG: hypothetical protein IT481_08400 [Gammaproteobacteria bacterium]|nr:hypothetical protein [Gammaproteobacteria bacterium]
MSGGSNVKVADRVDAVMDCTRARADLNAMEERCNPVVRKDIDRASERIDLICIKLRRTHIERGVIRHHLDALLATELPGNWHLAFVRMRIGRIKRSLALKPDPLSTAALQAWEAGDEGTDRWLDYVERLRAPAPTETTTTSGAAA